MSSILKALKKLEAEKAARLSGQVEISRAILTEKAPRSGRRSRLLVIGCVLVMACGILGSMALWLSGGSPPSGRLQANAPQVPAQPAPAKASPSPQPIARPSNTAPAPQATVVPRRPAAAMPSPVPLPIPAAQASRQTSPPPQRQMPATPVARPLPAPPSATPQPPVETMATPVTPPPAPQRHAVPALRVSGIAWQKDSASRLAIVNGQPVGLGVDIGGATVDEIFPDRVRFTYKGEKVEVGLGRSTKDD